MEVARRFWEFGGWGAFERKLAGYILQLVGEEKQCPESYVKILKKKGLGKIDIEVGIKGVIKFFKRCLVGCIGEWMVGILAAIKLQQWAYQT